LIDKKTIAVITLSCIIIITPWCIRNYYLSGYLIYPFPFIDIFNPTWKIPVNDVISEKQLVSSYAWIQKYDTNFYKLNFITKLKVWWRLLSIFRKLIFTIIFITPLVIIATYKKHMHLYIKYMDVYLISWGCFIFWFILAPDFRFGNAYIVFCSVFLLLVVDIRLVTNFIYDFLCKYNNLLTFSFTTILFILSIIILFSFNGFIYPAKIQKNNFDGNVKMSYYMVDSIKVWYPINDDRCFDEELPCTNFKRENLRMLGNQIKDGFKTQSK
jgi:hypothetical protein